MQSLDQDHIHKTINRLRLYHTALIIIGIALSVIIMISTEPITGIILLVVLWSAIGLLMAYLTTKIKDLDVSRNRTAPIVEPGSAYAIPIYNVQTPPVANNTQAPYYYNAPPATNGNVYPGVSPYSEVEKPIKQ